MASPGARGYNGGWGTAGWVQGSIRWWRSEKWNIRHVILAGAIGGGHNAPQAPYSAWVTASPNLSRSTPPASRTRRPAAPRPSVPL